MPIWQLRLRDRRICRGARRASPNPPLGRERLISLRHVLPLVPPSNGLGKVYAYGCMTSILRVASGASSTRRVSFLWAATCNLPLALASEHHLVKSIRLLRKKPHRNRNRYPDKCQHGASITD